MWRCHSALLTVSHEIWMDMASGWEKAISKDRIGSISIRISSRFVICVVCVCVFAFFFFFLALPKVDGDSWQLTFMGKSASETSETA